MTFDNQKHFELRALNKFILQTWKPQLVSPPVSPGSSLINSQKCSAVRESLTKHWEADGMGRSWQRLLVLSATWLCIQSTCQSNSILFSLPIGSFICPFYTQPNCQTPLKVIINTAQPLPSSKSTQHFKKPQRGYKYIGIVPQNTKKVLGKYTADVTSIYQFLPYCIEISEFSNSRVSVRLGWNWCLHNTKLTREKTENPFLSFTNM